MNNPLLPIRDAGRFLGYGGKTFGKSSVFKHIKEGRLVAVRIRRRTFVTRESAEQLIQASSAYVQARTTNGGGDA